MALNISKTVHHGVHFIADNLLKVALNTNKTGHHVIHHNWHIVESGIKYHKTDHIIEKVALNTNKTGHHVIHHNWHIVESDIKHQ